MKPPLRLWRRLPPLLLLLLAPTGCALLPPAAAPGAEAAQAEAGGELLFNALVGEFALQRGRQGEAVAHYDRAAALTRDARIAERNARIARYAGRGETSLRAARRWAELDPERAEAHRFLVAQLIDAGLLQEAQQHLRRIIALRADAPFATWQIVARQMGAAADPLQAQQALRALVEESREVAAAWYGLALFLSAQPAQAAREDALESVRRALELQPESGEAILLRASLTAMLHGRDMAIAWIRARVAEWPENDRVREWLARALVDAGREEEAIRHFEQTLQADPDNAERLIALGVVYLERQRLEDASALFLHLRAIDGHYGSGSFWLGRVEEERGDAEAASILYAAVSSGPFVFEARIRGALLLAKRDIAAGLAILHRLAERGPDDPLRLLLAEGEIYVEAGRYSEALQVYDRGLEVAPYNEQLLYARALTGERAGRLDILERDLRLLLAHNPDHYHALNALGYTLVDRTDRYQEGLTYIERALALRPRDFYILDSMGWAHYKLGRLQEAARYLRQALARKKDPEVAAHLGEVLWASGRKEEARRSWRLAIELDPKQPTLVKMLERFDPFAPQDEKTTP